MTDMSIVALIDAAALDRVVVFGSPPPGGRDLDVVARRASLAALRDALEADGFVPSGAKAWARLDPARPLAVELVPARSWGLPPDAEAALFDAAIALDGCERVCRPAPHHQLLILARRLVRGGPLDDRRRARVDAAVAEDPDAWSRARAEAPAWKAVGALDLLAQAKPAGLSERAAALAQEVGGARAWRAVLGSGRRAGVVVALSGVDGSGKTSQTEALMALLDGLGVESVRVWTRLSFNERLWKVGRAGKRVLAVVAGRRRRGTSGTGAGVATGAQSPVDVDPSRLSDDVRRLRYESRFLTFVWSTLVALENGLAHRRQTRDHIKAGRVVVCDRYVLDSAVHLRYRYGESRPYRFQRWIVRALSPPASAAFYLDVEPATAVARKVDQYDEAQLARQVRLYREECGRWGVVRMEGERPAADLAADIARVVWPALRPPTPKRVWRT
ncbi:MAG: hypothetical protein QOK43_3119 [Acidimicrobiaceae bacterium]|nr:hypothetical protein [Acidimicrobiaceae bacterium]